MGQSPQVRAEIALLSQYLNHPRRRVEAFGVPAVIAHLLDELAGPAAEVEQAPWSAKRNPALARTCSANDNASRRRSECGERARRLRRVTVISTQQGQLEAAFPTAVSPLRFFFMMGRIIGRIEPIETFRRRPRVREGQSAALATHNTEGPAEVRQKIFGNEDCFMARIAAIWAIHALHFNRIGLSRTRTRAEY